MDVSIKELKDHLSECLRKVQGGQRLTVTDHGRPVAEISPLAADRLSSRERLNQLVASGELTESRRRGFQPVKPSKTRGPRLSKTVLEGRR
ncbi:MAG: type II toxin-antitoxin system prevent-host-death family antitoxin [Myxococcaceae bacterium]|nr:type II toxin-antitoxin system prevent-host-death family antitoxin [Myxococcaceae bacterium]